MSKLIPNYIFENVYDIDINFLKYNNIRLALIDLDNTLAKHNCKEITEEVRNWLNELENNKISVIIFSNNNEDRVKVVANDLNLDYIYLAKKPSKKFYKKITDKINIDKINTAGIGDQIFTDVLGANRYGVMSIFVHPIASDRNILMKIKRKFEQIFI
ncbi:MAG: YqeG family HAD IIIA-type phosphatase, partial [Oscillospiraceae bacterium]